MWASQLLVWVLGGGLALACLIILSLWEWTSWLIYWKLRRVTSFSLIPIIGDMIYLANKTPEGILSDLVQKLDTGEFKRHCKMILLGYPCVNLFHPDDVEIILGGTVNIKKGFEYHPLKLWLSEGLLVSDGTKWKQRRKLLTPTFHFRILHDNVGQIAQHTEMFVKKLLATKGRVINLEDVIKKYTLDVICETAMGIKMNAQSNESQSYVCAIKRASETAVYRLLKIWLIRDWLFYLTSRGKQFLKDITTLHNFSERVIKSRQEERANKNDKIKEKSGRKAFLDILLEANERNPGLFSSLDIREEVDTFMFEGHDTTSAAVTFALYSVAHHAEIQERLWEEQKGIFGSDKREPTMEDLHEMHYLDLVIKEVLRLYPPVPYISRKLAADTNLSDGIVLPVGTNVCIMPYLIHRHPEFWEDAEAFQPERFLQGSRRHPYSYVPFSAGPRNCIGSKFALLEIKTTLSAVIRNCKVEPVTRTLSLAPLLILRNKTPVQVKILPRQDLDNTDCQNQS